MKSKPILAFCLIIFLMSLPVTTKERMPVGNRLETGVSGFASAAVPISEQNSRRAIPSTGRDKAKQSARKSGKIRAHYSRTKSTDCSVMSMFFASRVAESFRLTSGALRTVACISSEGIRKRASFPRRSMQTASRRICGF